MKKLFYFPAMAACAAAALFSSCKDDGDNSNFEKPAYAFSIAPEHKSLTVPALGDSYVIAITSTRNTTRIGYRILDCPEWADASPDMTGLSVRVGEYLERDANHTGKIVLQQDESDMRIEIDINQASVVDEVILPASLSARRLQIVAIEPEIKGYRTAPEYRWSCDGAGGGDSLLGAARNLFFIPRQAREYTVRFVIKDGNITETKNIAVSAAAEDTAYSSTISGVFEYRPAPGWRVGPTGGYPNGTAADTKDDMAAKCLNVFKTNVTASSPSWVSLGDWGGYIVFGFDHTVINGAGLRDFRITSSTGKSNNTRPGVIMVSLDVNGNGLPDDEWYEIAGSEHMHVQTWHGESITYYNPYFADPNASYSAGDDYLKWNDSRGNGGYIPYKQMPNAIAQYPLWYPKYGELEEKITFGDLTRLRSTIVMGEDMGWGSFPDQSSDANYKPFAYGYACNLPDSDEKGTSIDISWAIDASTGRYVDLPGINFVKVYTGTFKDRGGSYGEADTDVKQAYDLHLQGKEIASE